MRRPWIRRCAWAVATYTALGLLAGCIRFDHSDTRIARDFAAAPMPLERFHAAARDIDSGAQRRVYVARAGDPRLPLVAFVHGSPGAWSAWSGLFRDRDLLARFQVLAIDRPGYGKSDRGRSEGRLKQQAADLGAALAAHAERWGPPPRTVLVGHSYGGPVVVQAAIDRPQPVDGVVLVAASVDPDLEATKWFQHPVRWWPLSWLVPTDLATCNEEILALEGELRRLADRWAGIRAPVRVLHGERDGLVPVANADFVAQRVTRDLEIHRVADMDHFVPWSHPELIVATLVALADRWPVSRAGPAARPGDRLAPTPP